MLDREIVEKTLLETMQKYKDFPITKKTLLDIKRDIITTLTELHPKNGKMIEEEISRVLTEISGICLN